MKINITNILYTVLLNLLLTPLYAKNSENLYLQTDKDIYISGEKIGFKCVTTTRYDTIAPILFIDICGENSTINSQIIKCKNHHWEGYITIPDTVQTGVYLLRTYIGNNTSTPIIESKLIPIFNRFGNNDSNENKKNNLGYKKFELPEKQQDNSDKLQVKTDKTTYGTNETIQLDIINNNKIQFASGGLSLLINKVPEENIIGENNNINFETYTSYKNIIISNNLYIRGKLTKNHQPVSNQTMLLSIPDSIPQINYAITNTDGEFKFILHDLYGLNDIIIQSIDKENDYKITIYPILLLPPKKIPFYIAEELEKSEFVTTAINRATIHKAYGEVQIENDINEKQKIPFYGKTDKEVLPSRYVDLGDFNEIAWEILPLVRYKYNKKGASTIKIWNIDKKMFHHKPWVIVDGIPIFNYNDLYPLKSTDIEWIDIQDDARCYGNLYIDAAMSIKTYNGDFSSIKLPKNAVRKTIKLFSGKSNQLSHPLFKDVLLWKTYIIPQNIETFEIETSNEKGKYCIIVQQITKEGKVIQASTNINIE